MIVSSLYIFVNTSSVSSKERKFKSRHFLSQPNAQPRWCYFNSFATPEFIQCSNARNKYTLVNNLHVCQLLSSSQSILSRTPDNDVSSIYKIGHRSTVFNCVDKSRRKEPNGQRGSPTIDTSAVRSFRPGLENNADSANTFTRRIYFSEKYTIRKKKKRGICRNVVSHHCRRSPFTAVRFFWAMSDTW